MSVKMLNQFSRTELIIGKDGLEKLKSAKVAILGIGGVGSFVLEGLVRAGVHNFILVDDDKICLTNLNRQIIATRNTVGRLKVEVAKERVLSINPNAKVEIYQEFFMPDSKEILDNSVTYIVDAVDTVTAKIELVVRANKLNIPIISCMGTGNKLDPTKFEVTDIYKTSVCPLAKVMRKQLKKRNIKSLKVVYSKEEPIEPNELAENSCKTNCICPPGTVRKCSARHQVPGSISFVPSVAGLIVASEVIKDILKREEIESFSNGKKYFLSNKKLEIKSKNS
jgi:tRNA A37 threonylcarbamoyladenosine dehydratase